MQYTLEIILSDFLSDVFLIFVMNIETSMELYNGGKPCCSTFSCHDLDAADGLPVLNGTAFANAMNSIQLCISQNRCHCIKRSLPFDAKLCISQRYKV